MQVFFKEGEISFCFQLPPSREAAPQATDVVKLGVFVFILTSSPSQLDQALTDEVLPVMSDDSLLSSHPIVVNVSTPAEITAVFDGISYSKVGRRPEVTWAAQKVEAWERRQKSGELVLVVPKPVWAVSAQSLFLGHSLLLSVIIQPKVTVRGAMQPELWLATMFQANLLTEEQGNGSVSSVYYKSCWV